MQKLIILIMLCIATSFACYADTNSYVVETENFVSEDTNVMINDVKVIRSINGGSIIIPVFDETCPEEIKAPFEYACKILEENMPPCLPLKVEISCMSRSAKGAISTVSLITKKDFGETDFHNAPMSMIKGVHLAELSHGSTITFANSINSLDIETLTSPDISIVYNTQKFGDISFSIDPAPSDKYDFISLALRDLLTGLGLTHRYTYNRVTYDIDPPKGSLTPFEMKLESALSSIQSSRGCSLLEAATCSQFAIAGSEANGYIRVFAPSPWNNYTSLKYFIPTPEYDFTNILAYDFGKGTVYRSLNDGKMVSLFQNLLGWQYSIKVGGSSSSFGASGSSSILVPYNGSLNLNSNQLSVSGYSRNDEDSPFRIRASNDEMDVMDYIDQFKPYLTGSSSNSNGISICILKKDGTWDLVKFQPIYNPLYTEISLDMNEWTFHYDNDEYARTVDGYLRARVSTRSSDGYGGSTYESTFFVVDYLPQVTKLSYRTIDSPEVANLASPLASPTPMTARVFFADIEGVSSITLEILRQGNRIPSKINITDIKKGYHDISISRTSTVTAVAYNKNGSVRSLPLTVVYQSPDATQLSELSMSVENGMLNFIDNDNRQVEVEFSIIPISSLSTNPVMSGVYSEPISIDSLEPGMYVVKTIDSKTGASSTFKLKK